MDALLTIIGVIIGLVLFAIFANLILSALGKATNTRISYFGEEIAGPDTFDGYIEIGKNLSQSLKKGFNNIADKSKRMKVLKEIDGVSDKVELLDKLSELKQRGDIDEQEFESFKKSILDDSRA